MSKAGRPLSRRLFLKGGFSAAGAGVLTVWTGGGTAVAAPSPEDPGAATAPGQATSANGWPIEETVGPGYVQLRPVEGTDFSLPLRVGEVAAVLIHVVRRFHYEIDVVEAGQVDGFRPPSRFSPSHETNHSSGTAVDIRREWYPTGASGGFTAGQLIVLRDILAECEGVVRWGGDHRIPDESHFQIDVPPGDERLPRLAGKLRGVAAARDAGPGTGAELAFTPERQRRALTVQRQQRAG